MSTKVSPTYASLVIRYLEEKLNSILPDIFDDDFTLYIKENWKRYLDDCLIFWTNTEEDLLKFHFTINELQAAIKFPIDVHREKLPFLDILIIKDGGNIITDLLSKETDFQQYLDFDSCHPSHTIYK